MAFLRLFFGVCFRFIGCSLAFWYSILSVSCRFYVLCFSHRRVMLQLMTVNSKLFSRGVWPAVEDDEHWYNWLTSKDPHNSDVQKWEQYDRGWKSVARSAYPRLFWLMVFVSKTNIWRRSKTPGRITRSCFRFLSPHGCSQLFVKRHGREWLFVPSLIKDKRPN